jgi:hypothetical protein
MRYIIHRHLHLQQAFGGQVQTQELGAQLYVSATISGPADTAGYPATLSVDSILPDSGTPQPVADNMAKFRAGPGTSGLTFVGRLSPKGEFRGSSVPDTALAQTTAQLVGNFRDFFPRIPAGGVRPGNSWTDTIMVTQRGSSSGESEITRRVVLHATVPGWEPRNGIRSQRIETSANYSIAGSGQNGGQPFEVRGAGVTNGHSFLAEDGRFLGGESKDSATFTVSLPVQQLTLPVVQVIETRVTAVP